MMANYLYLFILVCCCFLFQEFSWEMRTATLLHLTKEKKKKNCFKTNRREKIQQNLFAYERTTIATSLCECLIENVPKLKNALVHTRMSIDRILDRLNSILVYHFIFLFGAFEANDLCLMRIRTKMTLWFA